MHYKNGREAKNGDRVMLMPGCGANAKMPVVGILYDAVIGQDYCNGRLAIPTQSDPCPNLKECLHLDDVLDAVKSNTEQSFTSVAGRASDVLREAAKPDASAIQS